MPTISCGIPDKHYFFSWSGGNHHHQSDTGPYRRRGALVDLSLMITGISEIGILVRDYDEAKNFYINVVGFELAEDTDMGEGRRWVTVTPPSKNVRIVFTKAVTPEQVAGVGKQGYGKVIFFLNTDDFMADYQRLEGHGVKFFGGIRDAPYGKVTIFEDLYGNRWDLIQPVKSMVKSQRKGAGIPT